MKNLKILCPTLLAVTLPLAGFAAHDGSHFYQGFYIGGAAGLSRLTADFNQSLSLGYTPFFSDSPPHYLNFDNRSFDQDVSNGMGQAQIGYAVAWEWLFAGLEVSVNGSQLNLKQNNEVFIYDDAYEGYGILISESNVELHNFEPVVDLKLGFNLSTKTYLYGRVGAAFNTITLNETTIYDQYDDCDGCYVSQYFRTSDSDSVVALRFGAGIEHKPFDQVSFALDYVHTDYGNVSTSGSQPTKFLDDEGMPDDLFITNSTQADVVRDVVTFAVNYYFW
jgi:opacity protein-like surface antigen